VLPSSRVSSLAQFAPAACSVAAFFLWGTSDFAGGYASRRANAFTLTAFTHVCALAFMFAIALGQHAAFPARTSVLWALVAGAVGGFSLAIFYRALAAGQMGLTAPIAALMGAAIPALADVAIEGAPRRWTVAGFVLAIVAIWLITRPEQAPASGPRQPAPGIGGTEAARKPDAESRPPQSETDASGRPKGVALAALAGVGFAGFYLCIHQASGSPAWIAVISRVGSLTATAAAVAATRAPMTLDRPRAALGVLAGFLDISASALFIFASQRGRLDEAVVITSLYPAVTVLLARLVLKEHLSRWRFVGLLAALAAVPLIAAG
jgi:drug/metabolite transporter (DMT)-like permease